MNAVSAVSAASISGVAPLRAMRPPPDGPSGRRAFTSAPLAMSLRMSCSLVRLPVPSGTGSPSSSPRSGFRIQDRMCSGV